MIVLAVALNGLAMIGGAYRPQEIGSRNSDRPKNAKAANAAPKKNVA